MSFQFSADLFADGSRHVSNELTIHTSIDLMSDGLMEVAKSLGSYTENGGKFDFAKSFSVNGTEQSGTTVQSGIPVKGRQEEGQKVLEHSIGQGITEFLPYTA